MSDFLKAADVILLRVEPSENLSKQILKPIIPGQRPKLSVPKIDGLSSYQGS